MIGPMHNENPLRETPIHQEGSNLQLVELQVFDLIRGHVTTVPKYGTEQEVLTVEVAPWVLWYHCSAECSAMK